jgi:hypothetical protein
MTERDIAAFPGDRIAVVVVAVAGVAIVVFFDYWQRGKTDSPCQVCG